MKTLCTALFAAVAAFAVFLTGTAPAHATSAGDLAVICDREIAPYRALLDAFTSACDCAVRVIPPQEAAQPGLEQRLKAAGVRVVLAVGGQARAAVEGLRDLPVVLTMVPQVQPWVDAQANRSGIDMSLSPRQHLETLRRVFPRAKRVGLVFDPAQTGGYVREAQAAAAALNLSLETREIAKPGELSRRLEELRGQVDVIWVLPDPTVLQAENLNVLLLASFESRVPLYCFARKYVELGAIAASQFDFAALGGQVAELIRRASSAPAALAPPRWEYARGTQFVLNQKVARKMGIVLDPDVLEAAADVIR
ncbi:MAG: ABC transporter substrate-binding protein [Candidatus Methylomirabilia bacterium]